MLPQGQAGRRETWPDQKLHPWPCWVSSPNPPWAEATTHRHLHVCLVPQDAGLVGGALEGGGGVRATCQPLLSPTQVTGHGPGSRPDPPTGGPGALPTSSSRKQVREGEDAEARGGESLAPPCLPPPMWPWAALALEQRGESHLWMLPWLVSCGHKGATESPKGALRGERARVRWAQGGLGTPHPAGQGVPKAGGLSAFLGGSCSRRRWE